MSLAWAILPFQRRTPMRRFYLLVAVAIAMFAPIGLAQHAGPYKVLKTARVGGEGGWDYIYADVAGRRLYIPRRGTPPHAVPAGIYFDSFDESVYVLSHPTTDATVIDAKDGNVLGTIVLGGVPEQGVG